MLDKGGIRDAGEGISGNIQRTPMKQGGVKGGGDTGGGGGGAPSVGATGEGGGATTAAFRLAIHIFYVETSGQDNKSIRATMAAEYEEG